MNRKDFIRDLTFSGLATIIGSSLVLSGCSRTENQMQLEEVLRRSANSGLKYTDTKIIVTDGFKYVNDPAFLKAFGCEQVLECTVSRVITQASQKSLLDWYDHFKKFNLDLNGLAFEIDPVTGKLTSYMVRDVGKPMRFPVFADERGTRKGMSRSANVFQPGHPYLMTNDFAVSFFNTRYFKSLLTTK